MNLLRYWTNSIAWQEDSLGGQSPRGSIMQWGHEVSDPERERGNYIYSYGFIEPETTYEIAINVGTSFETGLERLIGCVMIGIMPDEGLEEALLSLHDMLEFYNRKPSPRPVQLARTPINGTIVGRRKRPDLVISE